MAVTRKSRASAWLLTLLVLAVFALHQDLWNWTRVEPLIFGFLPVGLAYHAGYSILAAILMAVLVRFAWPHELEQAGEPPADRPDAKP
jgi:hypothetical protein